MIAAPYVMNVVERIKYGSSFWKAVSEDELHWRDGGYLWVLGFILKKTSTIDMSHGKKWVSASSTISHSWEKKQYAQATLD